MNEYMYLLCMNVCMCKCVYTYMYVYIYVYNTLTNVDKWHLILKCYRIYLFINSFINLNSSVSQFPQKY